MNARKFLAVSLLALFFVVGCNSDDGLKKGFYDTSCPEAEKIVREITWSKSEADSTLGAKLLRLHFHDCFVLGCDGSILLDSVVKNQSEKTAVPNLTVGGFDVIDDIKKAVEEVCPDTMSCADIVALAARDAISFPFKKSMWDVPTGRRDGTISLARNVLGNIPTPFQDFNTLTQNFSMKGLNMNDLVVLSGAHSIGVARCGTFSRRLYNFTGKGDADPSLNATYAAFLRNRCPNPANPATVVEMDPQSSLSFDNHYFDILMENKGLFQSDAALLTNRDAAKVVQQLRMPATFFSEFGESMKKMGAIEVLTGTAGEIRKNCRVVNH